MTKLESIRRQYGNLSLLENNLPADPFQQFATWLNAALAHDQGDATAMVLATVDAHGMPDTRIVLLKEFNDLGFIFYTDYQSHKAQQVQQNPNVALNFYWPLFARQVRIRGYIEPIAREQAEAYFNSRPRASQIAALASKQSSVIPHRDYLEERVKEITEKYQHQSIPCPAHWGGYLVKPFSLEFFQGRDNRLNDRILYQKENATWHISRLSS